MTRTSISHPLQIAAVDTLPGHGRIGITLCPGKVQLSAATGAWDRDLLTDIKAISDWGAAAVVTLVEDHELVSLKVEGLGAAVARAHMDWLHAPIPDADVPSAVFEAAWVETGEGLRDRVRAGFDILVHCKGGLGRAGMIAARLLVELGLDAETAITRVRQTRPGAIETSAQEAVVRRTPMVPERQPGTTADDILDRARGALLGLAVGDALGTTLEFKARDTYEPLTDLWAVAGGQYVIWQELESGSYPPDFRPTPVNADELADMTAAVQGAARSLLD